MNWGIDSGEEETEMRRTEREGIEEQNGNKKDERIEEELKAFGVTCDWIPNKFNVFLNHFQHYFNLQLRDSLWF